MQAPNLQEMVYRLGRLPLDCPPGKAWMYSASMDIEGYIVEKLSGMTLPEFMRKNIFEPVGMNDLDTLCRRRSGRGSRRITARMRRGI